MTSSNAKGIEPSMTGRYVIIYILFCACLISALVHLIQEWRLVQSVPTLLAFFILWLLAPSLNVFVAGWFKCAHLLRTQTYLSIIYSGLFVLYALRGSTAERQGAQHLHLLLVPFLCMALLLFVYLVNIAYNSIKACGGVRTSNCEGDIPNGRS